MIYVFSVIICHLKFIVLPFGLKNGHYPFHENMAFLWSFVIDQILNH